MGLRTGFHPVQTWRENSAVASIAFSAGVASLAMNFWFPFLPLYMIALGAVSDVDALFWVGVATTGQGFARLVSGPFWGVVSDRFGRKLMYVRALFFATATTAITAVAQEPWHVAVAFACQGFFSGFIPAAVALTSVTVPDRKLSGSLGMVAAAQYIGNTVGPAAGAGLALAFGLRGAIVAGALMPAASALLVLLTVPRDRVGVSEVQAGKTEGGEAAPAVRPPISSIFSVQFGLAVFMYFFLFATSQLVRLATPIALKERLSDGNVEGAVGIAFTVAGVGSVIGVLVIARRWVRPGRFVVMLVMGTISVAVAHVLLALSPSVLLFMAVFMVISMLQAAMIPATNTLIAAGVPRERRGTAFGIASSAQAVAFMAGPMGAAGIAAVSLTAGFGLVGGLFLLVGLLLWALLREPPLSGAVEEKAQPVEEMAEPAAVKA